MVNSQSLFVQDALGQYVVVDDDTLIAAALRAVEQRIPRNGTLMTTPFVVRNYLSMKLGTLPHEVFGVLFLNSQHGMIAFEVMFRGTLTQTSVYPREVVKRALELNCAACVLVHNHPSGSLQPSRADELLTKTMKDVLALIDVRVLDHVIISGERALSMAELGLV